MKNTESILMSLKSYGMIRIDWKFTPIAKLNLDLFLLVVSETDTGPQYSRIEAKIFG